jgi:hypothetical protein
LARRLYADGQTDVATICRTLGISRATFYRTIKPPPQADDQATEHRRGPSLTGGRTTMK